MHGRLDVAGRSAVALAAIALMVSVAASCTQDFDQFFQGPAGTGATGGGGIGGGGGECNEPADCPGLDTTCEYRSCENHQCGMANAPASTPCTEEGGRVCDSAGHCVECAVQSDCEDDEICQQNQCVPASCANGVMDNTETDVDCGGGVCNPCQNGQDCLLARDCYSRFCDPTGAGGAGGGSAGSVCAPCSGDSDCLAVPSSWCDSSLDGGTCVDKKDDGDICSGANECLSGYCPADDGVCCATACTARCQACLQGKTGSANGTCELITAGTDPDSECAASAPSTCGSSGDGCTGTSTSCILYDGTTECAPQSCTGNTLSDPRLCDGNGSCQPPSTSTCPSGYLCDAAGAACRTSCSNNTHCLASYYCDGSACQLDKGLGAPCGDPLECQSNFCPFDDGVCCDAGCTGICMSCLGADTGGSDGNCDPATAGTDPDGDCTPNYPCGRMCDGNASPACEPRCPSCADLYGGDSEVNQVCGFDYQTCVLNVSTQTDDCETICQRGGGRCLVAENASNTNDCTLNNPGTWDCSTTGDNSILCTCSHGCDQDPPCNPATETCTATGCN